MPETSTVSQFENLLFAILIVGFAIAACAFAATYLKRRFNFNAIGAKLSGNERLGVIETVHVDQRRKLVLIRKDGAEHLILIGGPTDVVIESNQNPAPRANANQMRGSSAAQSSQNLNGTAAMLASGAATTEQSSITTEQEAIDFFDKARDRIFAAQDQGPSENASDEAARDDTDDFQALLRAQQKAETPIENLPVETPEQRIQKLRAMLDQAEKEKK